MAPHPLEFRPPHAQDYLTSVPAPFRHPHIHLRLHLHFPQAAADGANLEDTAARLALSPTKSCSIAVALLNTKFEFLNLPWTMRYL